MTDRLVKIRRYKRKSRTYLCDGDHRREKKSAKRRAFRFLIAGMAHSKFEPAQRKASSRARHIAETSGLIWQLN